MNTAVKLSVFGLSLTVVFGGAWAVGSAVGPGGTDAPAHDPAHRVHTTGPTPATDPPGPVATGPAQQPLNEAGGPVAVQPAPRANPAPVPARARPVHRPGAHHGPPQGHPRRGHHR